MPGLSAQKSPSVPRMSTEPVKVICFDTLLQVLILKVVSRTYGTLFGLQKTGELALRRVTKSPGSSSGEVSGIRAYCFTEPIYKGRYRLVNRNLGGNSSAIVTLDDASFTFTEHSD